MLPSTASRVPAHTAAAVNEMIRQRTEENIARYRNAGPAAILRNAGNIVPPHGAEQNLLGVLKVKQPMPHDAEFELARPGKARRPIVNNFSRGVR